MRQTKNLSHFLVSSQPNFHLYNMKKLSSFILILTFAATACAQMATDKPLGLFKITKIASDSIEIDLRNAALDQYQLCGDSLWAQMAMGANNVFAIELTTPLAAKNAVEKGEYESVFSNYDGQCFKKWKYNTDTSSQIFPMNSWIIETCELNKATEKVYHIMKCLAGETENDETTAGIWKYDTGGNGIYYRAYSDNCYVTFTATAQNKYIGELTIAQVKGEVDLTCDSIIDNGAIWKPATMPSSISNVLRYIIDDILSDVDGANWSNKYIIQPEFIGGKGELMLFIHDNIKYPKESLKRKSEGKTFVTFIVNTDGSISDIKTIRSCGDFLLDKEAERVVGLMPKWKPGLKKGVPVPVRQNIPVIFRLK